MLNLDNRESRRVNTPDGIGALVGLDPEGKEVTVQFPSNSDGRGPGYFKCFQASECEEIEK